MAHPYQHLLDTVSGLGKDCAGAQRQLSELISLHECVAMLSQAKNIKDLVELFSFTVLGEHPCRSALVLISEEGCWKQVFFKGASKSQPNIEALEALESNSLQRKVYEIGQGEDELDAVLKQAGLPDLGICRVVPLVSRGRLVGLLGLGLPLIPTNLELKSQWLLDLCDLFAVILASSLDKWSLQKVNRVLEKRLFQLQTIREVTDVFIRCYEKKAVFRALSQNLMGQFFISRSAFVDRKSFKVRFTMGCKVSDIECCMEDTCSKSYLEELKPFQLTPLPDNPRFAYAILLEMTEGGAYILLLGPRLNGKDIESDDENLALAMSRQAAAALDNIRLQEQRLENERMLKELELARSIQQKLLPVDEPKIPGYEVAAEMRPFQQVGGDFFDWFKLGDTGSWAFCLADVSGKSLPASMIMTTTQASLRALSSYATATANEIVDRLNKQLCQAIPSNRFVTMFFGVLNPETHRFSYINAGHNPPYFFQPDSSIRTLRDGGMVLGMFSSAPYNVGEIEFTPGSELLVYTDGISELVNEAEEEYGDDRVARWLESNAGQPSLLQQKEALFNDAVDFSGNKLIDDMTVVMLRRNY